MPKLLIASAPRKAVLSEYVEVPLLPDQVKVEVEFASPKHGSELADFRNESPFTSNYFDEEWRLFLPKNPENITPGLFGEWNLGNQWVGRIIEAGSEVRKLGWGDRICGYGGIRETFIANEKDVFKMPENMSWQNAVCLDPVQFALSAIRDSHIRVGDTVAIFGLGAIGQLAAQLARIAGAGYVAVVDPIALRREVALKAGADAAFDPIQEDVGLELKKGTGKKGVDVIIETSANEAALNHVFRGLAYGGTVVYVGWARSFRGGLDLGKEAHFNNAKVIFSRACSVPNPDHPRWGFSRIIDVSWSLLSSNRLNCVDIIYPVVSLEEAAAAYEEFVDRAPEKSIKLGVKIKL